MMLARIRTWLPLLRNKYVLITLAAFIWLLFFDRYYLLGQKEIKGRIRELEADKKFYLKATQDLRDRQAVLKSDIRELERFAREKYYMKRKDEDVFLVKSLNREEPK